MVARSYRVVVAEIKSLLITALVSLETRFKVLILSIFGIFQGVCFGTSLLPTTMICFTCNKRFFIKVTIQPKILQNPNPKFEKSRKICSLVWHLQNTDFSSTDQKDLKLGQCLDMDNMTSPSKFGDVT